MCEIKILNKHVMSHDSWFTCWDYCIVYRILDSICLNSCRFLCHFLEFVRSAWISACADLKRKRRYLGFGTRVSIRMHVQTHWSTRVFTPIIYTHFNHPCPLSSLELSPRHDPDPIATWSEPLFRREYTAWAWWLRFALHPGRSCQIISVRKIRRQAGRYIDLFVTLGEQSHDLKSLHIRTNHVWNSLSEMSLRIQNYPLHWNQARYQDKM